MKVWKNFKKLSEAAVQLNKRICFEKCHLCQNKWAEIETEYIHMTTIIINKRQDQRFICDDCLQTVDNEEL